MPQVDKYVKTALMKGKHYIVFKSGAVQRWGARNVGPHKDYASLNATLWRKAGCPAAPLGAESVTVPGSTYYFDSVETAMAAASVFIKALKDKGVI